MRPVEIDDSSARYLRGIGEERGPRAFPPTEINESGRPERLKRPSVIQAEEAARLIVFNVHAQLNCHLRNEWTVRVGIWSEELDALFGLCLHHFDSTCGLLEHGQPCMRAAAHPREVNARNEVEGVVLHALRERVAGIKQIVGQYGNQAQIAGSCGERPVDVVGAVISLPLRFDVWSIELVRSLRSLRRIIGRGLRNKAGATGWPADPSSKVSPMMGQSSRQRTGLAWMERIHEEVRWRSGNFTLRNSLKFA